MKNKLPLLPAALLLTGAAARAQTDYPITWEAKPVVHKIPDTFRHQSAVFILDQRRLEYKNGDDNEMYVYRTTHRIIRLLDDKGVESFNKITIPIGGDRKVLTIKARTILPGGRVI